MRWCPLLIVIAIGAGCDRGTAAPAVQHRDDRQAVIRSRQPEALVQALELAPGARVADLGAGRGFLEPYLAAAIGPDGRIVATDIDPAAVAALGRLALSTPVEARRVEADDPGLEAGAYDLVLLAQLDHLLADRAAYLARVRAALAPGGRVAVSNRIDREAAVRAAAASAGLEVVSERHLSSTQFVLVLAPRGAVAVRP